MLERPSQRGKAIRPPHEALGAGPFDLLAPGRIANHHADCVAVVRKPLHERHGSTTAADDQDARHAWIVCPQEVERRGRSLDRGAPSK
jgi:hypothetical protein